MWSCWANIGPLGLVTAVRLHVAGRPNFMHNTLSAADAAAKLDQRGARIGPSRPSIQAERRVADPAGKLSYGPGYGHCEPREPRRRICQVTVTLTDSEARAARRRYRLNSKVGYSLGCSIYLIKQGALGILQAQGARRKRGGKKDGVQRSCFF